MGYHLTRSYQEILWKPLNFPRKGRLFCPKQYGMSTVGTRVRNSSWRALRRVCFCVQKAHSSQPGLRTSMDACPIKVKPRRSPKWINRSQKRSPEDVLAVDTNILIRYFTRDDAKQSPRSADLIHSSEVWISKTVLLEAEWVLRNAYGYSREMVVDALARICGLSSVAVEGAAEVAKALEWTSTGMDFADALHLSSVREGDRFVTLDDKFAKRAQRLRLPVELL